MQQKPQNFLNLLKVTDCCEGDPGPLSFERLVELTQNKWLRPTHKERWDLVDSAFLQSSRNRIISELAKLGFINEIKPKDNVYDAVLFLGASDINLIKRIDYLSMLSELGISFDTIYFLTGGIVIPHDVDFFKEIKLKTNTDTELIEAFYKSSPLNNLKNIKTIPIIGKKRHPRPNTEDTVRAWLEKNNGEKKLLVISNQPFVLYQDRVVKRIVPYSCAVDTVGEQIDPSVKIAVLLDTVARYFYECTLLG